METELGKTISELAISLLQEMNPANENVFFSPASIAVSLGMLLAGAGGKTREQILKVLKCDNNETTTHKAFASMVKVINTPDQSCQLYTANRLYSVKNYSTIQRFIEILADSYGSELKHVNFADPAVCGEINEWVADVTKQKIRNFIQGGLLGVDTRLLIVNAIYFKGNWFGKFEKLLTYDEDFHVSPREKIPVKMMTNTFGTCSYASNGTSQAIQLPYRGDSLNMVIILPNKKDGLNQVLNQMNAHSFLNLISSMKPREVVVSLPRFKMETSYDLRAQFARLGMVDMFSAGEANFTRITKNKAGLYVSGVIHKAFVESPQVMLHKTTN